METAMTLAQPAASPALALNHLNLVVDNLDAATEFMQRCLDFQLLERKGQALAVLGDGAGFVLVLSSRQAFGGAAPPRYPEGFHLGFVLRSPAEVDQMHARLDAGGVRLEHPPRTARGAYAFYFHALDGLLFEVSCPL
jgi:catechol 2,3-dioxygenase-like lactoylglutathione lyase family enzyme